MPGPRQLIENQVCFDLQFEGEQESVIVERLGSGAKSWEILCQQQYKAEETSRKCTGLFISKPTSCDIFPFYKDALHKPLPYNDIEWQPMVHISKPMGDILMQTTAEGILHSGFCCIFLTLHDVSSFFLSSFLFFFSFFCLVIGKRVYWNSFWANSFQYSSGFFLFQTFLKNYQD